MDKKALIAAMKASISEVLETMFFMPIDFLDEYEPQKQPQVTGETIAAKLAFTGPGTGWFLFCVPETLAREVCADFLGIDVVQVTQDNMTGTVKEMINMLAGNALSRYDPASIFNLGIPELTAAEDRFCDKAEINAVAHINVQTLSSRMHMAAVWRG